MNANEKTFFTDGPMKGNFLRDMYLADVERVYGDFPGHYEHVHVMEWVEENRDYKIVRKLRYFPPAAVGKPLPEAT